MAAAPERPKTRTSSMCIAETAQGTHQFEVSIEKRAYVSSDTFAVGGHEWCILFNPLACKVGTKLYAGVFLDPMMSESADDEDDDDDDQVEAVKVRYDFKLLNRATGLFTSVFSGSGSGELRGAVRLKQRWGTHTFIERTLLMGPTYEQDGHVVIECDVTVEKNEEIVEVTVPPSDLVYHLGELLNAEHGTDVAFEVRGQVFHAHRIILSMRSKVFMQLLYGSTSDDKETRRVFRVEDTDPDAFMALLHFIYKDSFPAALDNLVGGDNTEETVWRLLVAAEKYAMEKMKMICIHILCKRLDGKRVAGTFDLAEKHRCDKVRDACIEFMKRECPAVYIDILEKAARTRKI